MAFRKVDLIPAKVDSLSHTQAVASHEKHQHGVPPTVAAVATSLYELLKLLCCEVTPPVTQCSSISILRGKYSDFPHFTVLATSNSIIFARDPVAWKVSR